MNGILDVKASVAYVVFFKAVTNENLMKSLKNFKPSTFAKLIARQQKYIHYEELFQCHELPFFMDEAGPSGKRKHEKSSPLFSAKKEARTSETSQQSKKAKNLSN